MTLGPPFIGAPSLGRASPNKGWPRRTVRSRSGSTRSHEGAAGCLGAGAFGLLAGGGSSNSADNGFAELAAGVNEILASLILGTEVQPPGTYGSTASAATFKDNEFFSGPGMLTVIPEPGAAMISLVSFSALLGLQRFRSRTWTAGRHTGAYFLQKVTKKTKR